MSSAPALKSLLLHLADFTQMLQVTVTHSNSKRKYKVKGIKAEGGAASTFFMNEQEGREMSVAEYFEKQYNLRCCPCSGFMFVAAQSLGCSRYFSS